MTQWRYSYLHNCLSFSMPAVCHEWFQMLCTSTMIHCLTRGQTPSQAKISEKKGAKTSRSHSWGHHFNYVHNVGQLTNTVSLLGQKVDCPFCPFQLNLSRWWSGLVYFGFSIEHNQWNNLGVDYLVWAPSWDL